MRLVVATVFLGTKELISGWWCSRKEARPRGKWIPRKEEYPQVVDYSEGGVSLRTAGWYSQGEALFGTPYCLSLGVSDKMGHVSWFWCRSEIDHYRCPFCFLFLQALRRKSGADWLALAGEFRCHLYSERTSQIHFRILSPLETGVGENSWQINDQNSDFMMDEIVWPRQFVSSGFDMQKNPGCKPTL